MNTPPENDFAELRRLLALKRHEQPPPGYFTTLSSQIISALEAERRLGSRSSDFEQVPLWITHLLERLQTRPAFAWGVGAALCSLLLGGIVVYEKDVQEPAAMPSLVSEVTPPPADPLMADSATPSRAFQPVTAEEALPLMASNSVQSPPSLFDVLPPLETAPVSHR